MHLLWVKIQFYCFVLSCHSTSRYNCYPAVRSFPVCHLFHNTQKIGYIQKFKYHDKRNILRIYGTMQYRWISRLLKILVDLILENQIIQHMRRYISFHYRQNKEHLPLDYRFFDQFYI